MDNFTRFKAAIQAYMPDDFQEDSVPKSDLLIPEQSNQKVKTYYAPFESINFGARLILVGITPGRTQMNNALKSACQDLHAGLLDNEILQRAKQASAFSGGMQKTLCGLLDRWNIPNLVGADNALSLWDTHAHLVHFTSSLKNPVFIGMEEKNYTGKQPDLHTYTGFQSTVDELVQELRSIPRGLILPLGSSVTKLIDRLVVKGHIEANRVLNLNGEVVEFPHPSGTNGERCKLAMLETMPFSQDYVSQKSKEYIAKKQSEGITPCTNKMQRYAKTRLICWYAMNKSRQALEGLNFHLI